MTRRKYDSSCPGVWVRTIAEQMLSASASVSSSSMSHGPNRQPKYARETAKIGTGHYTNIGISTTTLPFSISPLCIAPTASTDWWTRFHK